MVTSSNSTSQATPVTISITTVVSVVIGVLTWLLQSYVFHSEVPKPLQPIIPIVASTIVGVGVHIWTVLTPKTNK